MLNIGERIQMLRKQRGYNQDQLAEMASLNRVTIAKYESGRIEPGAQALARIADALGVSIDYLMGREEEPHEHADDDLWDLREQLRRDPDLGVLFSAARNANPEHVRAAAAMLRALKESNDAD